ncbi:TolC family protein [Ideonella sp. YS5]|uniref:TolC family protein n=1 Tax=Ideonella sp. YS5 TaxID=3453714 RepID=UPI003EEA7F9E
MRKLLWPLGLAAFALSPVPLAAQTTLTLERALEQALRHSAAITAAAREVEAADGALEQAGARRNPVLNLTLEDTRSQSRTTTATVDVPLELGGQRGARVAAAARARDVAAAELARTRAEFRSRVTEAYFAVVVAQERHALAAKAVDLATRGADVVARRAAAGKASPVEATRAQVEQAQVQLSAAEANAAWQRTRFALASLMGDGEPQFDQVSADVPNALPRPPLAELAAQLEHAPMLAAARLEVGRRRALAEVERTKAMPDVTLSLGSRRDNELGRSQAVIGLSIPLPLFDRNQGAIREANQRADRAADDELDLRRRLLVELQDASSRLAVANATLQTLQSVVLPAAQQAQEAASRGFEAGKFGVLDVLDAQRTLLQARSHYLDTLAAAHRAATDIDRVVGR